MDLPRTVDAEFWKSLNVEAHPVAPLPDAAWIAAHTEDDLIGYLLDRQALIDRMRADPLHHGYEPPIWGVVDALCGFPWVDPEFGLRVRRRLLGQDEPVKVLLLNGGNRGSKSEWAASRVMRLLLDRPARRAWCFHQDQDMSRQYQQPLLYKYLPPELRTEKGIKRNPTYIAYKQQTGFSDDHFVLPNYSDCDFRYYEQDFKKIQGGELDVVWCDELVPATWVKELKARVATRSGWMLITFTPIEGYTATVKLFLDLAKTTVESIAYVLPRDGGDPRKDLALAGEDPRAWLEAAPDRGIIRAGQPAEPPGRAFDRVPRIMRMPPERGESFARSAVAFFHSFDNPFGNAQELFTLYSGDTAAGQKMRFYGVATKMVAGKFPTFNPGVHVVRPEHIPTRGTRYMICDPCDGRNWAMAWMLVDRSPAGRRLWFYREWPCPGKYVPGVGDMGNWAEPGDKHDGERGPAQDSLGWGLERYRQEIDRLEGRKDWDRDIPRARPTPARSYRDRGEDPDLQPDPERAAARPRMAATPEGVEEVYERIMDSRFGNTPTPTREGLVTLIDLCAQEVDLHFVPASGSSTTEDGLNWIHLINDLLAFDETQPVGPLNSPRLFVSEECRNLIFALQNWTNEDGLKGACKDFVDLVKYAVLHDCDDWSTDTVGRTQRERTREKQEAAA